MHHVAVRTHWSAVAILATLLALASAAAATHETLELGAEGGRILLRLGSPERGCPLAGLYDRKAHRELLMPDQPIWSIELRHASGETVTIESDQCGPATVKHPSADLTLIDWRLNRTVNVNSTLPAGELKAGLGGIFVKCLIRMDAEQAHMRLVVQNGATKWSLRQVNFPRLRLLPLGASGEDDTLVLPRAAGTLVRRPIMGGVDYHNIYPELWNTIQFCAYWDTDGGLYVANEDPRAATKFLHVAAADKKILEVRTSWPAEDAGLPANGFGQSGESVLQLFDGDWFDAAQIYRRWAAARAEWWPALQDGKRSDTPAWFNDIAVWMLSNSDVKQAVQPAVEFAKFMGVPTAIHWYGWHQIPFDNDYPHYFPAREGFADGVKQLQQAGIRVMPYINGRLWDSDLEDFRLEALPAATKDEKGEFYVERYGSGEALVPMCPTTKLWQDKVQEIVLRLLGPEFNVDAVYIDQVAAAPPRLCFDRSHRHPPGGGHWWNTQGYWPMIRQLRFVMADKYPDKAITTECNSEPFTHLFDGYLTWHCQLQDQIPLFAAVYGGTIQTFGRQYGGNDQLAHRMKIGESLVFGEQLGWIAPTILEHKETAEFLRAAARVRYGLREFLAHGTMVRPPELRGDVPAVTADWAWGGKSMVTASAVQRGAWRSADGRIAFLFANVSDQPVKCEWHFDPARYDLPAAQLKLNAWPATGGPEPIQGIRDMPIEIEPRTIRVKIMVQ